MNLQRYVSPDLTHFVGAFLAPDQKAQFGLLRGIIRGGALEARPKAKRKIPGIYQQQQRPDLKLSSNDAYAGPILCFCDIPAGDLSLHIGKYSMFGLAFRKEFLVESGVTPVMYVPQFGRPGIAGRAASKKASLPKRGISRQAVAFDSFFENFNALRLSMDEVRLALPKIAQQLEELTNFMDLSLLNYLKFFDNRLLDDDKQNFYMEREWRTTQNVKFELDDIERIIIPREFSRQLRNAFRNYDGEVLFAD